jgi:enoyl-CoA hydratase
MVVIDRPEVRNAVDEATAARLFECFERFESDDTLRVAVLCGAGGNFCSGYDLKALAARPKGYSGRLPGRSSKRGPMGPTRMELSKPVVAAIEGFAVAGGLELALWCDLRVAARDATFGVFNRRFGVPLIDLGTVRLPRIVGQARALDLILTGRPVPAVEAMSMGLVQRLVEPGRAVAEARKLAAEIAKFPQSALRADRRSVLDQWSLDFPAAAKREHRGGSGAMASGEAREGARRFAEGSGRHGSAEQPRRR